jgi:hypothetical protein
VRTNAAASAPFEVAMAVADDVPQARREFGDAFGRLLYALLSARGSRKRAARGSTARRETPQAAKRSTADSSR